MAGEQIRIDGRIDGRIVGLCVALHPPAGIGQQAGQQFDPNGVRLLERLSPARVIDENDPDPSWVGRLEFGSACRFAFEVNTKARGRRPCDWAARLA